MLKQGHLILLKKKKKVERTLAQEKGWLIIFKRSYFIILVITGECGKHYDLAGLMFQFEDFPTESLPAQHIQMSLPWVF